MLYFCVGNQLANTENLLNRDHAASAEAGRRLANKNLIQEIYSGPEFVCIFKTFCMINFLTKPSINDWWSVLLFDFQSDNPEFLIGWRKEKGENLFTKSIVPQSEAAAVLVSHSFIDFPQKQTQRRKMHLSPGKKTHKEPCAMNNNLASAHPVQSPRHTGGKGAISLKICSFAFYQLRFYFLGGYIFVSSMSVNCYHDRFLGQPPEGCDPNTICFVCKNVVDCAGKSVINFELFILRLSVLDISQSCLFRLH